MAIFQRSEIFSVFNRHCFIVCISTVMILFFLDRIINTTTKSKDQYCDAIRIQEHYMNNLSAYHLLQTKPVRSNLFAYTIVNDELCGKDTAIDLLIIIISKPSSYKRRDAIRRTFGNLNHIFKYINDKSPRLEVRILFMINIDGKEMESILFEQRVFNDIVQVKIPDQYLMNTYLELAVLDWSSKHCLQARFIFKINDSVFINPFLLLKFIHENEEDRIHWNPINPWDFENICPTFETRLPLLYGFIQSNENVLREKISNDKQSENFILSKDEYPCEIYPKYLNYNAYLISQDARDLILCTFYRQSNVPLPISEIYITGVLAEYLNIERQSLADYEINFDRETSCETFFTRTNPLQAFACVTNIELSRNIFELYHTYWQIIINSQVENMQK